MRAAFHLKNAVTLVTVAAKVGPGDATRITATIQYPEFRQPYRDLARYLDLFGPCKKKQAGDAQGWWSGGSYGLRFAGSKNAAQCTVYPGSQRTSPVEMREAAPKM